MNYKLESIKIEKFKKLPAFEVKLANINILVGTNGSGKSSVLQGIHLASCSMRQAPEVNPRGRVIPISELDYLPTDAYPELGNDSPWGNKETSPGSKFTLEFLDVDSPESEHAKLSAWCELRAARNAGISIKGTIPPVLQDSLRKNIFSAYIPGISGIPNKEEKFSKRVVQRACSFGDSNVYLRNILYLLHKDNGIETLVALVNQIIAPNKLAIDIKFNEEKHLSIQCFVSINHRKKPIELIGTGYLQLIHIFAYILLLKPGLVLIDEPDNHLHPTIQEKLIPVLNNLAVDRGMKIILATHSPYIVRGAPLSTQILWMMDGKLQTGNRSNLELAIGWGLMGKKLLILSEDQDTTLLKKILSQWPDLERQITVHPGNGYKLLTTPEQAEELTTTLQGCVKILIHRDRDSMVDGEVAKLQARYSDRGVTLWVTPDSDIESYFCAPWIIAEISGFTEFEASDIRDKAIEDTKSQTEDKFKKHRKAHNQELWAEGGSPTNDCIWDELQSKPLKGAYGKGVFERIQARITGRYKTESIVAATWSREIASDLKLVLEQILAED